MTRQAQGRLGWRETGRFGPLNGVAAGGVENTAWSDGHQQERWGSLHCIEGLLLFSRAERHLSEPALVV